MKKTLSIITALIIFSISINLSIAQTTVFSENFEGAWTSPSPASWASNVVATSADAWHRNDYTTNWTSPGSGSPVAAGASSTTYYARFHSYWSSATTQLYNTSNINLSAATAGTTLQFYYINPTGTDNLKIYFSNNGGATWSAAITTLGASISSWTLQTVSVTATYYVNNFRIRFDATGDLGNDDIGLDQVSVIVPCAVVAGTATGTASICSGATAAVSISGQSGGTTLLWQSSPDNATWSDIPGATSAGYTTPALTATTYYRCSVTNSCTVYTNSVTITVAPIAGTATATNSTVCSGTTTSLTLTGYTGSIQWQSSPDNLTWTNIAGATSATYATAAISSTIYYKAIVSSGGCSSVSSNVLTITVVTCVNMTNGSSTTCAANFYDSGGPGGNTGNSENYTYTFYPATPGNSIQVNFSSFATDNTFDFLYIYNGNSITAPLIGSYTGASSPGIVTSCAPDGSLTFKFTSDGSVVAAGWAATISCVSSLGSKTWVTTGTTAWTTSSNWSPVGVPGYCDDVIIPSGGFQPTIAAGNAAQCRSLNINSGATLTAAINAGSFNVYGNVIIDGTLNHTGPTLINLNGTNNTIGGSGTTANAKLNFNNGCNYTLSSNLTIYNLQISYASAVSFGTVSLSSYMFAITNTIAQNGFINLNTGVFRDKIFGQTLTMNRFNHNSGTWWWDLAGQAAGGTFNLIDNDFYSLRFTCDPSYTIAIGEVGMTNLTLGGDLTIDANTILSDFAIPNTVVPITLKGTWTNNGTFTESVIGNVTFNGTTGQSIAGSSTTVFTNLTINNTSPTGVTLNAPADVSTAFTLTDGNVYSSSTNLLTIRNGATSTSGSAASFVDGPMRKIGTTAFVFPVGDNTIWARIAMAAESGTTAATDAFTAQYYDAPYSTLTPVAAPNAYVSSIEHWIFNRTTGTLNNTSVTLYWENGTRSGINTFSTDLHVARWNGAIWADHGSGTMTGSAAAGSIQTSAPVTSFSPFTFASTTASIAINPLPIELLSFNAECNSGNVLLKWSTATETNNSHFTIDKSTDGINFIAIGTVAGAGNSTNILNYLFTDDKAYNGIGYYRLKQTDYNGDSKTSDILTSENCNATAVNVNAFNNQAGNLTILITSESTDTYTATLFDAQGKKISVKLLETAKGSNDFYMDISHIIKGIYFLTIDNSISITSKKIFIN